MKHAPIALAFLALSACGQADNAPAPARNTGPAEPLSPAQEGRLSFGQCAVCHSYQEGQPHRIGPNLYGIYGAEAGKAAGFSYTAAVRDSGLVWDEANLNAFMENPQGYLRGNRMAFMGETDAETRANIIAFLKTLGPETE